ncbi:Lpp/OprI family alanine-zipper lipoprotein [Vibrio gallicus]|uniref:Lpp/OprI family alanine-zipper lipoprotein n=1 Tax=Vibrio gallicus TaxID=190897 RepID=UPI0021C48BFD|nr:Lpp/OprI family alanine-zipper lipoprotein [Vibrio gallicus]
MKNKILLVAGVSSVLLLAGCASGPDEATTAKMNDQDARISQLEQDVSALKAAHEKDVADNKAATMKAHETAKSAQDDAARANERLDNVAQSYTK